VCAERVLDPSNRVDDDALMGIMNSKGIPADGQHGNFLMERE